MRSLKTILASAAIAIPMAVSTLTAHASDIVDTAVSAGQFNTLADRSSSEPG